MSSATLQQRQRRQREANISLLNPTQLAPSYPQITAALFQQLSSLLLEHHATTGREVRSSCVRSLVLLRNRDVITSEQ
jgi:protein SDA1